MYESFYGLREKPFNIAPDPSYLYLSNVHREAMANLKYGIQEGVGFIVLTGEVGTGKTLILHSLLKSLDEKVKSAYIFYPKISFQDMLRLILNELDISIQTTDVSDMLSALNGYLIERYTNGQTTVLIIDEAQDLDDDLLENIRLLSNLETAKSKLLTIILVGQPELHRKLERPELRQLKQRIVVRYHLTPLDRSEVKSYIHHRLRSAGAVQPDLFNDKAVTRIASYSEGVPRLINIICDNALLLGYAEEENVIGVSLIDEAIEDLEGGALATAPARMAKQIEAAGPGRRWSRAAVLVAGILALGVAAGLGGPSLVKWIQENNPANPGTASGPGGAESPANRPDEGVLFPHTPVPSVLPQEFAATLTPVAARAVENTTAGAPSGVGDSDVASSIPAEPTLAPPAPTEPPETAVITAQPTEKIEVTPSPTTSIPATSSPTIVPESTPTPTIVATLAGGLLLSATQVNEATMQVTDAASSVNVTPDGTQLLDLRVFTERSGALNSGAAFEYGVQIASLKEGSRVRGSTRLVESLGAKAIVAKPYVTDGGTRWIRVFATGFNDEAEARAFLNRAQAVQEISNAKPFLVYIDRGEGRSN